MFHFLIWIVGHRDVIIPWKFIQLFQVFWGVTFMTASYTSLQRHIKNRWGLLFQRKTAMKFRKHTTHPHSVLGENQPLLYTGMTSFSHQYHQDTGVGASHLKNAIQWQASSFPVRGLSPLGSRLCYLIKGFSAEGSENQDAKVYPHTTLTVAGPETEAPGLLMEERAARRIGQGARTPCPTAFQRPGEKLSVAGILAQTGQFPAHGIIKPRHTFNSH